MSTANDRAFPTTEFINDPAGLGVGLLSQGGLTKRELFAAMAMQGWVTKHITFADPADGGNVFALRAAWSVAQADALLAELEKSK